MRSRAVILVVYIKQDLKFAGVSHQNPYKQKPVMKFVNNFD